MPTIPELVDVLRRRIDAFPPSARAELLHVLMLPDFDRVARIGEFWASPATRTFGELLIDLEEDRVGESGSRRDAAGKRRLRVPRTTPENARLRRCFGRVYARRPLPEGDSS